MASLILASFAHHNENQPNQNLQFLLLDEKILEELSPHYSVANRNMCYMRFSYMLISSLVGITTLNKE